MVYVAIYEEGGLQGITIKDDHTVLDFGSLTDHAERMCQLQSYWIFKVRR
jgi:hypothetical protein